MPKLAYTHDLREQAGQVNSATEPKKNLVDFQTLAAGLDWENIAPISLSEDHVYDPGGGAPQPLKVGVPLYIAAPGNWTVVPGSWQTVPGMSASFTVEFQGGVGAGIFIVAACDCANQVAGVTNQLRIVKGEGGGGLAPVGLEFAIGEVPQAYTPGSVVVAYQAADPAQVVELQFNSDAAGDIALTRAQMWIFVVNR